TDAPASTNIPPGRGSTYARCHFHGVSSVTETTPLPPRQPPRPRPYLIAWPCPPALHCPWLSSPSPPAPASPASTARPTSAPSTSTRSPRSATSSASTSSTSSPSTAATSAPPSASSS